MGIEKESLQKLGVQMTKWPGGRSSSVNFLFPVSFAVGQYGIGCEPAPVSPRHGHMHFCCSFCATVVAVFPISIAVNPRCGGEAELEPRAP